MQRRLEGIQNSDLKSAVKKSFFKVGSGIHPSVADVLRMKPAFEKDTYDIENMYPSHVVSLM